MNHAGKLCAVWVMLFVAGGVLAAEGRTKININPVWRFHLGDVKDEAAQADFNDGAWDLVSLPHTHEVFAANLNGFPEHGRNIGWYRRAITAPEGWLKKKVFLEFQGAMQTTKLWVNGAFVGEYAVSGYDSFHFDITPHLKAGKNWIAVRVDNSVNPNIPPDGQKTDFIQFGGLYRDVNVIVTDTMHLTFPWEATKAGVVLTLPEVSAENAIVQSNSTVRNELEAARECTLVTEIRDRDGAVVASMSETASVAGKSEHTFTQKSASIAKPKLWSPADPYLYRVTTIVRAGSEECDRITTNLGVRWFKFDKEKGFFLNGEHLKLVGANRHQTWPFIGNALPNALHRRDAEQMKEMGCNWVRCSHYPHDPDFLDALDELGILALEEGPTWMKTGPKAWWDNLEKSFRSEIRRDRNHPSIVIWNSCVNHSGGNKQLGAAASEEDPTRPRGQIDVPCPMNFSHKKISGGSALTIEHTGHTFATTRGEMGQRGARAANWVAGQETDNREYEQARRHYEHTDAAYRVEGNSGLAVWCMYDYNTFHNAQDGIARHGVFDLFRIPKYSYGWHLSELTEKPMAYIVRVNATRVCVFSNCQEIRLSQDTGGGFTTVATQKPDEGFVLRHPPFHFTVVEGATALKAEGLIGGSVKAVGQWKKPLTPAALTLEADRSTITADGSDISRLVVSAVDANGTVVDGNEAEIRFAIEGMGQLIGENPIKLRDGKIIILVQSAFVPGEMKITATSAGLKPATVAVKSEAVAAGVDMPAELPARQPTIHPAPRSTGKGTESHAAALKFDAKTSATPGAWVESDPIMLDSGGAVTITGGEYRIYTAPWTAKPGKAGGGDAIFVRVQAPAFGAKAVAEITIGSTKVKFEVQTTEKK